MISKPSHTPSLRLVNTAASPKRDTSPSRITPPTARTHASPPPQDDALAALAAQRGASPPTSDLAASDARWVFAVRVAHAIEPGPEPLLLPERRRRLLAIAKALGLRPFDANLIIAIVQDAARSGDALNHSVEQRLGLIRPVERRGVSPASLALVAFASALAASAVVAWAVAWVVGG